MCEFGQCFLAKIGLKMEYGGCRTVGMSETRNSSLLGKITVLVFICYCSLSAQAKYGGGTGEPNDPYQIWDANHMQAIGGDSNDWDKCFKLMADVDLRVFDGNDGRPQFNMIADYPDYFVGIFDGNDHVIRNFTVSLTGLHRGVALFRNAWTGAVIKNLDMENTYVNVPEGNRIASIHGEGRADIINCKVSGTIIGDYYVGGLSGQNSGNTESCYSYCTIVGGGGGGLIGRNSGIVNQCCSRSIVSGSDDVGGLVGRNYGLITNSYSDSSVTSDTYGAGGLVGENTDTILSCYALGNASGDSWVGGLIGEGGGGLIENCYSLVDVNGNTGVGGLIGLYSRGTISNSYSSGSVSGSTDVGGLLGIDYENKIIVTSCYFLDPNDGGGPDNGYGEPLTDTEMKQQASFIGWDFVHVWNIGEKQTYPYLRVYLAGDINKDGIVNFKDFAFVALQWMEEYNLGNRPPEVLITYPEDGDRLMVGGVPPQTLIIVEADDYDGTVVRVEFFDDELKLGEDSDGGDGWNYLWQGYSLGWHVLTATAWDEEGLSGTSPPVNVEVWMPFPPPP